MKLPTFIGKTLVYITAINPDIWTFFDFKIRNKSAHNTNFLHQNIYTMNNCLKDFFLSLFLSENVNSKATN